MRLEASREADRFRPNQHRACFLPTHFRQVVHQEGGVPEKQLDQAVKFDLFYTVFFWLTIPPAVH